MKCKKHPSDYSSAVGVCASCLRERLLAIMDAQAQAQAQIQQPQLQLVQDRFGCRNPDVNNPPPALAFPRSVSPYISRRKSDNSAAWQHSDQRFYSTPQVGPAGSLAGEVKKSRKNGGRKLFSFFSGIFRSKSESSDSVAVPNSDRCVSAPVAVLDPRDPCTSSPSWFSAIVPSRRQKPARAFSLDVNLTEDRRRNRREDRGRGMSPTRFSDDDEDGEHFRGRSSGYSSESSQGWRQTPKRTPARMFGGGGRAAHHKNISGLTLCLSPLVRASPNRHRNQKGLPPESAAAGSGDGDGQAPPKPRLSAPSSFGKNRSRKLADFGRYNANN